jgi:nucleoside-diphosphate-sugar epimerase
MTADEIAETVIDGLGLEGVEIEHAGGVRGWPGDTRKCILTIQKLRRTGWRPKHSSENAVRRATRLLRKTYFDDSRGQRVQSGYVGVSSCRQEHGR